MAKVNPETIRFYEREGILPPASRTQNGYRSYSASAVQRIEFVGRVKSLGFSLEEIRGLLQVQDTNGPACLNVKQLLVEKLAAICEKKQALQRLGTQITAAIKQRSDSLTQSIEGGPACPVFCCLASCSSGSTPSHDD